MLVSQLLLILVFKCLSEVAKSVEGVNWAHSSPHLVGLEMGSAVENSIRVTNSFSIPSGSKCNVIVASSLYPYSGGSSKKTKTILSIRSIDSFDGSTRWSMAVPIILHGSTLRQELSRWESIFQVSVHEPNEFSGISTPYKEDFFSGIIFSLSREVEGFGVLSYKLRGWNADVGSLAWETTLWQSFDATSDRSGRGEIILIDVNKNSLSVPDITVLASVGGELLSISTTLDSPVVSKALNLPDSATNFIFSNFISGTVFYNEKSRQYRVIGCGHFGDSAAIVLKAADKYVIKKIKIPDELTVSIQPHSLYLIRGGSNSIIEDSFKLVGFGCGTEGTGCQLATISFTLQNSEAISSITGTLDGILVLPSIYSDDRTELLVSTGSNFRLCQTSSSEKTCDDILIDSAGALSIAPQHDGFQFERLVSVTPSIKCSVRTSADGSEKSIQRWSSVLRCSEGNQVGATDDEAGFTFSIPAIQSTPTDPFAHLSIFKSPGGFRLFAISQAGLPFALQFSRLVPQPQFEKVLWERDEWPGHIKQALILDSKPHLVRQESGDVFAPPKTVADFFSQLSTRLSLQKQDLTDFAVEFVDSILSLKDKVSLLSATLQLTVDCKLLGSTSPACQYLDEPMAKAKLTKGDISKRKQFGFDKYAVLLSHSAALTRQLAHFRGGTDEPASKTVRFNDSFLQINAIKLLVDSAAAVAGGVAEVNHLWKLVPILPSVKGDHPVVSFVKFFSPVSSSEVAVGRSSVLLVSTVDRGTYLWNIDSLSYNAATNKKRSSLQRKKEKASPKTVCRSADEGGGQSCRNELQLYSSNSIFELLPSAHVNRPHPVKAVFQLNGEQLLLFHDALPNEAGNIELTRFSNAPSPVSFSEQYIHFADKKTGELNIYKVSNATCGKVACECVSHCECDCVLGKPVASISFASQAETLIDVVYPNPQDKVISKSSVLGDDSVLLKYLNPNMVAVTSAVHGSNGSEVTAVAVTLVDVASGRVIKKFLHDWATYPVHAVIIENFVVTTYWNSKFKRTELSSTVLYDGAIDKYELSPFAGFMSSTSGGGSAGSRRKSYPSQMSSFSGGVSPLSVQKTFILPRPVSALQSTVTEKGITNKHIIIALTNGQIYDLDILQIHPRRPLTNPTPAEKEEGLVPYHPYVVLPPLTALTKNYSVGWEGGEGGVDQVVVSPVRLESSALVFSFSSRGDGLAGCHLAAVMPSQGFDQLAPDFNHGFLVLILAVLAFAVLLLRKMHRDKRLKSMWA